MSGLIVGMTFRRLPTVDHALLLVALALAEQADSEGKNIFPSVDLVAAETRLSRRSVQYQIAELQKIGFLILVKKGGGRKNPNLWRIDVDWLETKPDRVKAMRAQKEQKNQTPKNGATGAPFSVVENLSAGPVENMAQTVQKGCKKGAAAAAPNPPTLCPVIKPPPLDELVEAALWRACSSNSPPRSRSAYAAAVRRRLATQISAEDVAVWQSWLRQLETRHEIQRLQEGNDAAA